MTIIMLTIIVALVFLLVIAVANYTLTLRELIFRLDAKLAEHLREDPRYTKVSKTSRDLAKRLGVDLYVRDNSEQ